MKINLILAHDFNLGIGKDNALPWNIKEELAFFKHVTNGHAVIMGRKTFVSLPFKDGLPNRLNIVITSDTSDKEDTQNVKYANSIPDAIKIAGEYKQTAFFIGGKSIYESCLDYVNGNIYISTIKDYYDCDTFIEDDFFAKVSKLNFVRVFYCNYDKYIVTILKMIKDI